MRGSRRRDTRPELALRQELHRRGLRYGVDRPVVAGAVRVRPDVVFPRVRVAVFVDGCWWHRCPVHGREPERNLDYWTPKFERNILRDRRVDAALEADGWTVIRIWEHESAGDGADLVETVIHREAR
ncbi:MAG TPA: very short patch repair endonuclease [Acidimicrobiales bacterium]|nr:very short patch repair endonuclease [Acidimicrobiales bacterium]